MTEDLSQPVLPGRGASDYERYLRTDELLSLQKTPEERVHHDELLFQTVHQSSELWLKFATTEVDEAAARLEREELGAGDQAAAPRRAGAAVRHHRRSRCSTRWTRGSTSGSGSCSGTAAASTRQGSAGCRT